MTLFIMASEAPPPEGAAENNAEVQKASNALSDLIVAFFSLCPEATDDQVHNLAISLGYEPEGFEEIIYKLVGERVRKDPEGTGAELDDVADDPANDKDTPNPAKADISNDPGDANSDADAEGNAKEKAGRAIEQSSWTLPRQRRPVTAGGGRLASAQPTLQEDNVAIDPRAFLESMDDFEGSPYPVPVTGGGALDDQLIDDGDPRPYAGTDVIVDDGEASGQADNDAEKIALINDSEIDPTDATAAR